MRCQWFALCTNPADGVVLHPILGDVPTCVRCVTKLDLHDRFSPYDEVSS